ncbi:MAG: hypothetical protein ACYDHY_06450 [Acidiferrobacterales bacterium]
MSIASEKLMELVEENGFAAEKKAGFLKIGSGGRSIYIAATKKVSRVDLSGFDITHPAVTKLTDNEAKKMRLGRVRAQLDFSKEDDLVLEAFATALSTMKWLSSKKHGRTPATVTKALDGAVQVVPPRAMRVSRKQRSSQIPVLE